MDNDLFHAEEVAIGEELDKLSSSEEIRQWATHYGLSQHPLVLRRLGEHRCDQCGKSFTQKKNLNRHIQTKHGGQKFSCVKCHRVYTWNSDRVKHERTCTGIPLKMATFDCDVCKKKCVTERGLQTHRQVHVRPPKRSGNDVKTLPAKRPRQTESQPGTECRPGTNRDIYCRRCNANFTSRRELYLHGMREHYQQGQGMQTSPYAQVPFEDEKLKEVYDANAPLILEEDRERPVQSVYNVPVANDVSVDVLMREAEKIYERQHHAFRLNLSLGVILRNTETGEYRYFKPYENDTLLESPLIVTRREDLEKLRLRLRQMDVTTYFLRQRPDTKWKPFLFTNIRFVVYDTKFVLGESAGDLPDYVLNNIAIEALERNKKLNQRYDDKLCAFRCLSLHKGQSVDNLETASRMYLRRWLEYLKARNRTGHVDIDPVTFSGIQFFDLPDFENCFQVNINAYQLREDGTALSVYKSRCRFAETMYVNMHGNHLSYIKDFNMYAKKYQCRTCEKHFHRSNNLHRHQRVCTNQTKYKYPGGFFQAPQTIFDKLAEVDVVVPESDRTFPWFVVYDFEAALQKVNVQTSEKLKWTHEHVPISVSVCSNVPGHTEATCFVKPEADELIEVMMEQMQTIAQVVKRLAESKWGKYKEKLEDKIQQWEGEEVMQNQLKSVCGQLVGYMSQVPVLGFNSARYDINLIKRKLVGYLHGDEHLFVVKKNNAYMCISTETLKFLDVSQFLAPGTSYVKFLKAYRVEEQKGYFPYEWFSDLSKLEVSSLPSHGAFYSSLKDSNISKEEYQYCQKVWREKNMDTFKDFLVWYNNLDVVPFVEAVTRLQEFYFRRNIDVFKTAISVPGIARQMLFATARKAEANFALFDLKNKELYETVKNNIVGGPSILFTRHHKAHVTRIRGKKKCRKIIGFDANALYLWAIGEEMPVGPFVIRKAENDFRPENRDKYMAAYHWMNWLNVTERADIQHKLNHGSEKRVGKYPVDGWDAGKNTIYQFHGCYFHGHECQVTQNVKDQKWWENRENRYKNTQETTKYLRGKGYRVEEMWECEYRQYCKDNPKIYDMIDATRPKFHQKHKGKVTEKQILNGVRSGQLFGMVEVDIEVPERWNSEFHRKMSPLHYFEEMSPLFCNSEVPFELIGQHMQEHVKKFGLWDKPRRLLVGGMKAKQMLIATPLLKWYLDHGMKVSKYIRSWNFKLRAASKNSFERSVMPEEQAM